ncbi:hypothetical protein PV327_001545 [Microctonus hyperodae]|uniref:Cholesterol side-chain cleavage enzyme, mitochondrial n=1 Tax=Microctonus hyperodae TaxID=165561 RepID=A0AA39G8T0_MICHY|nr:hypothetical protein PV327_001545 [Microctonus hyperodae]
MSLISKFGDFYKFFIWHINIFNAFLYLYLRLYPVVIGNGRCMMKDTVIKGYHIPKGVQVVFQHYVISNQEKYFPRSSEFLPERWINKNESHHTFASLPFGFGRRMCLGRRFADLEMAIVITTSKENTPINSPQNTPTKNRKSETEKKPTQIINRLDTWQIRSPAKKIVNYTQSFPKISPSRKIENINIVFAQSPQLNISKNEKTETKNSSSLINNNSLNKSNLNESQLEKLTVKITDVDKLLESSMTKSLNKTNEFKINNSMELNNSNNQTTPTRKSDKDESTSNKKYSPVSLSTIIGENLLALSELTSETDEEISDDCKTNVAINPSSRYLPVTSNFKERCKLMPIDEDKETISKSRKISIGSSNAFMESTKKSTALEQIVKRKMVGGNGLIQEIIQEFQKKCVKNDNPTFTKGSKKFVKKLVKSLEKSIHEDENDSENLMENNKFDKKFDDILQLNQTNKVNNSDRHSGTSSVTISLKSSDTDSAGSEPSSPTFSPSPDYNWSTKVRSDIENNSKKPSPTKHNNTQWIPLPADVILPRTSSALSMKSRSSSRSSSNKSPCISPITEDNSQQRFFSNKKPYWSWSHGINNTIGRRGSPADRYTVCDSGYAEQTSEHSLMIQSFLAEHEASQSFIQDMDTSSDRRLTFGRAPSILSRSIRV